MILEMTDFKLDSGTILVDTLSISIDTVISCQSDLNHISIFTNARELLNQLKDSSTDKWLCVIKL